jgi:hypothetical protein
MEGGGRHAGGFRCAPCSYEHSGRRQQSYHRESLSGTRTRQRETTTASLVSEELETHLSAWENGVTRSESATGKTLPAGGSAN